MAGAQRARAERQAVPGDVAAAREPARDVPVGAVRERVVPPRVHDLELSMRGPIWSVADFDGQAMINYQMGDIVGTGCADTNVVVMPTDGIPIQRGGKLELPGPVYMITETNVN